MLVTCNLLIISTVFVQELLGKDGVFLYPTFVDCANFHLENFYKFFNVTYTLIMNALDVPVTNCPVGMNGKGLPIGIQVIFHQLSSRIVTLFSEARGYTSSTTAKQFVTTFSVLPTYHCVTGLRMCYCGCHSGKDIHLGRHLKMGPGFQLPHCSVWQPKKSRK